MGELYDEVEYKGGKVDCVLVLQPWRGSGGNWILRVTFAYLMSFFVCGAPVRVIVDVIMNLVHCLHTCHTAKPFYPQIATSTTYRVRLKTKTTISQRTVFCYKISTTI